MREGEDCPFCGASRPRTITHVWKAAVLTAMMPLGLAACYGTPVTPPPEDPDKPEVQDPTTAKPDDTAAPGPQGQGEKPEGTETPIAPDPRPATKYGGPPEPDPEPPKPEPPKPDEGDTNSKPDGTDTPIAEPPRRKTKYGAPPRPKPKYGAPPRPEPKPDK